MKNNLTIKDIDRIIEMAWEDRTSFEAIEFQFGLPESEVIKLMRTELKRSSFNLWRKRVNSGISQKHLMKRNVYVCLLFILYSVLYHISLGINNYLNETIYSYITCYL